MAYNYESLKSLEVLMNEFFNNDTSNERKHEIEVILSNFGQQCDSWQHCFFYLTNTSNPYVSMFCLTTIENTINKRWMHLESEAKLKIRASLYQFLVERQKLIPNFIRNKLVKLIVDIARITWPQAYPDFMKNVFSLSQNGDTIALCVIFLQVISEEMTSSRSEMSYCRKAELKKLLLLEVPSILSLLTECLENVIEKSSLDGSNSTTPPPSPTHVNHNTTPIQSPRDSLLSSILSPYKNGSSDASPIKCVPSYAMESKYMTLASLTLSCLAHYISWIPVSSLVNHRLINAVFLLAGIGADPHHNKLVNGITFETDGWGALNSVSILAMSTINEIFSKNCIPIDSESFLIQTFKHTFQLFHTLIISHQQNKQHLASLDQEYLDKFTEFVRLIITFHLTRLECKSDFQILEFFGLFFRYTFIQPNFDSYYNCLEIWSTFLDNLAVKLCHDEHDHVLKYKEALIALTTAILRKIQFRYNHTELDDLDTEWCEESCYLDDENDSLFGFSHDSMSECQTFLANNLEIMAKVADIFPDLVFTLLYEPFTDTAKDFLNLESYIRVENGKRCLTFDSEQESRNVHYAIRDLASMMQGIGRLSILFLGENLQKRSSVALQVVAKLIEIATFTTDKKLFELETMIKIFQQDVIQVQAQVLSALRVWSHWLSQLYGQQFVNVFPGGTQTHQFQSTCHSLNKQLLLTAINVLESENVPPLIVSCGVQLLSSLSVLVRSPVALDLIPIQSLYTRATSLSLEIKVRNCLYRALVNFLLLPWPSFISDHKLQFRKNNLENFVNCLTKSFCEIRVESLANDETLKLNLVSEITDTLSMIRGQIDELNGADKHSRELYYQCVLNVIDHALKIFPIYINNCEVCQEILSVFVVSIQVLRHQIGVAKLTAHMQTFFDIFTTNRHLYLAVAENDANAVKVIEKFLKLLELIVCEPGSSFQCFVPSTISLCVDQIFAPIAAKQCPEIKLPLFKVLHHILHTKWKYFFKSGVQSTSGTTDWDACSNQTEFIKIIEVFWQSLPQPDINTVKQVLSTMHSLNTKYKLYHKTIFKTSMLEQFITVLLQLLIMKLHDILQHEILTNLYEMAVVDFQVFCVVFLPSFVQSFSELNSAQKEDLKNNYKAENDLPSFTQNILRLVNDLRYYKICNHTDSDGGIKF